MAADAPRPQDTRSLLIKSGILTEDELRLREEQSMKGPAAGGSRLMYRDPYFLSGLDFSEATGAARWDWDVSKTHLFCSWAQKALRDRFCLEVTV
ncbi:MAG: hypothetical protein HW403_922, partial [Dehalococcoidia bacterium]|nr:hypothetical protein [Dehalococcoidia bacterium]